MFMPVIMLIVIFGMTSFLTHTQESAEEPPLVEEAQSTIESTTEETQTTTEPTETQTSATPTEEKSETETKEAEGTPTETVTAETEAKPTVETPPAESKEPTPTETQPNVSTEVTALPAPEVSTESAEKQPTPVAEKTEEITMPTAPQLEGQETLIPEEPVAAEEPVGIDTTSLDNPQGNWLFKRIWWERAEERYEKIRILVDSIWESRNKFFQERNQLDRTVLDPFYINIGIDRGELQIILSEINDFLEKQREQQEGLSEQERMLYETYATEEETLKQLKVDVDMITNLDHAIDDALGTFMNQINRVRNYESEAWKNFKEIAHILNDTRARELYYMIEGAARNIKTISNYLEQEFFTHFHKLINEAKSRVARVQSQMDALKEKGVLFQRQAEQQQKTEEVEEAQEEVEKEPKPKPKLGWVDWILSGFSTGFDYVWSIIRLPYDLIFGK